MTGKSVSRSGKELSSMIGGVQNLEDLLAHSIAFLAQRLHLRVIGAFLLNNDLIRFQYDPAANQGSFDNTSDLHIEAGRLVASDGTLLSLPCFWDSGKQVTLNNYLKLRAREGVTLFAVIPIFIDEQPVGWIECRWREEGRKWQPAEQVLLKESANLLGVFAQKITQQTKHKNNAPQQNSLTPPSERELAKNQTVLDDAPWVIFDILEDGSVEYVSAKVEEIIGLSPRAIRSESIFDILGTILIDVYKTEAFRKLRKVFDGRDKKSEFFAEVLNPVSKKTRQFQFQAEAGRPGSGRTVLVVTDVSRNRMYRDKLDEAKLRSMRLVEYGNLIIIRTDLQLRIVDVLGDTNRILGIATDRLLHDKEIWNKFLEFEDFRSLARTIQNMGSKPHELSQEIRVINQKTNAVHWLLLNAVPLYSSQGNFIGWEGFGLDITDKRQTELELIRQSRRIEALYEVSRNVEVNMDPAFVALRGLRSLIRATGSDSGFCTLFDRRTSSLELVATQGCSQEYVDAIARILNKKNLIQRVIDDKKGFFTNNMQKLSAARYGLAAAEGIKSAIFMPLMYEDLSEGPVVVGCLQLACKKARQFTQEDFDLVQAAAGQIALIIRQAEYYEAEKREASSLAVLYRLSHSLTKTHSPQEVAEKTFAAIQDEIACRRMWFGVMNEQGTHLVGHGGFGPGMRDQLNRLQIEMQLPHDYLDEAIATRKPVVIAAGASMECSGLNAIMRRMEVGTVLVIPLISLGNVVGVLLLEPTLASSQFIKRKMPLLVSMANEVGAVLFTRKLESRIVRAEKMRMAGLLASGVAHNFNNLLQAVMGQASLIEMQLPAQSPLRAAAQTITSAAARGAELIKHMLSVSQHGDIDRKPFEITRLLEDAREVYASILGPNVSFKMTLPRTAITVLGDSNQLQQVLSNLLMNSKDALHETTDPVVSIETEIVRLRSGEVDPELSPGRYIRIDIADNGIGMDEEAQARCFEPFYTTKNTDKATGIAFDGAGFGLSLSYSILRQHEGLLAVRSTVFRGTVFSLYIPIAPEVEEEKQVPVQPPVLEAMPNQRLNALIVAVEDAAHFTLKSALESLGFATRIILDHETAMAYALKEVNRVGLLLIDLDQVEPGIVTTLRSLRSRLPQIKVLACSREPERWERVLSGLSHIDIVSSPIGVWAIHSAARKVVGAASGLSLEKQVFEDTETRESVSHRHVSEQSIGTDDAI